MVSLANAISPGIYSSLTDLSFFVSSVGGTGAIMVVFSQKGEDRVLSRVVSPEDLQSRFGKKLIKYGQGMLNAGQFVANSGNLYMIRATLADSAYSTLLAKLVSTDSTVYVDFAAVVPPGSPSEGDSYVINGVGTAAFAGHDFQVATYLNAQWSFDIINVGVWVKVNPSTWLLRSPEGYKIAISNIKGITTTPPPITLPIIPGVKASTQINGISVTAVTAGSAGNALNIKFVRSATSGVIPLSVSVISLTDITVTLQKDANEILLSTKAQIVTLLNTNLSTAPLVLAAVVVGNVDEVAIEQQVKYLTGGVTAFAPPTLLNGDKFIIDGPDAATGVWTGHKHEIATWNSVDSIWSFSTPAFWDWAIPANTGLITQYTGETGWKTRSSNPGMTTKIKLQKSNAVITSVDELDLLVQTSGTLFGLCGKGRGAWYNDLFIKFSPIITPDSIEKANKVVMSVYYNDVSISDITSIESFPLSLKAGETDVTGESSVIDHVINTYSQDLQIKLNQIELESTALSQELKRLEEVQEFGDRSAALSQLFISDELTTAFTDVFKLEGGNDGNMFNESGVINYNEPKVISALVDAYTGQTDAEILNSDGINVSLIYDANYPFSVKAAITQLSISRGDCGAIVDMTKNLTPKAAVDSRISKFTFNDFRTWLFDNVTQVFNSDDGKFVEVTPSYHLASAIPINDSQRNVWDAVVINNAQLTGIEKLTYNPNKAQRDDLYLQQINPIVTLNGQTTIWTQLTSQKRSSKLQDISSVRLYLLIDKNLKKFAHGYLPSANDEITWNSAGKEVRNFLGSIKADRGLESFEVTVGATEFEKRNKTFHIDVEFVPVNQTEKIFLNYTVR